jgi:hypothetical protein
MVYKKKNTLNEWSKAHSSEETQWWVLSHNEGGF